MGNFTFPRKERLRGSISVRTVFQKGGKVNISGINLFFLPNRLRYNRFLCTFRRGFGNAVTRNKSRRVLKEAYRCMKHRLKYGYDFIVVPFYEQSDFETSFKKLTSLFETAKVLN